MRRATTAITESRPSPSESTIPAPCNPRIPGHSGSAALRARGYSRSQLDEASFGWRKTSEYAQNVTPLLTSAGSAASSRNPSPATRPYDREWVDPTSKPRPATPSDNSQAWRIGRRSPIAPSPSPPSTQGRPRSSPDPSQERRSNSPASNGNSPVTIPTDAYELALQKQVRDYPRSRQPARLSTPPLCARRADSGTVQRHPAFRRGSRHSPGADGRAEQLPGRGAQRRKSHAQPQDPAAAGNGRPPPLRSPACHPHRRLLLASQQLRRLSADAVVAFPAGRNNDLSSTARPPTSLPSRAATAYGAPVSNRKWFFTPTPGWPSGRKSQTPPRSSMNPAIVATILHLPPGAASLIPGGGQIRAEDHADREESNRVPRPAPRWRSSRHRPSDAAPAGDTPESTAAGPFALIGLCPKWVTIYLANPWHFL